ncbi:mediator of DNA damage checkpoint protein 1 isoform X4 [Stegostoma tigrinum]|uniref:mediator of DNA damage checkpoint protein 1 isoform X4 n=1 Tax=Stegostoma tigrinum TaxID=3053191 RepID=UPI00202BA28C|nr:mediator of DNA damage checkpoint protein 1 isoform X4 [Stegostoma tigrinum]
MDQTQPLVWEAEEQEEPRDCDREPKGRLMMFAGILRAEAGFLLYQGENVIGRHESCHVHIPVSSVSKRHAVIEIDGNSHLIYDCNSLNKTRRRNAVLKPNVRYAINDGDLFLFADVACQYVMLPPAAQIGDSGSETDSESLFPHAKPGLEIRQPAGSEAAGGNLESAEDSLVLSPTQPYHAKSVIPLQSDTYVKESEDDDTPWKCSVPFTAQGGQRLNTTAYQTPSAHVVPESDHEEDESSHSNLQSKQLHYDSETDLEEDPEAGKQWTEGCAMRPDDSNRVNSEMTGREEQQADNKPPLIGVVASDSFKTVQATDVPRGTLDGDTGRTSSWESGAPPVADLLPHFSRDSSEEEKEDSQLNSDALPLGAKTDSNLTGLQEAKAAICNWDLIYPGTRKESRKADISTDSTAEAKEAAGGVNKREPLEENSDTDVDDDTESYALEPTQCFTLNVSDTQDEATGGNNHVPDSGNTAASNTEEDVTQPFIFRSPTFGKDLCKSNTATVSKAEEEATQLFTFLSPAPSEDAFKHSSMSVGNTEEEATQPFTFQSPTFSKDILKGGAVTVSDTEEETTQPLVADAAIERPVTVSPCSEPSEGIPENNQWAEEETQPFFFQNQPAEVDHGGEPEETEDTVPIVPTVDCPASTVRDLPDNPPGIKRQSLLEEGSGLGPQAVPEQPQSPEGGKGGHKQQMNEERSSAALVEQQCSAASEDMGKREVLGDTALMQESEHSLLMIRGQTASPDTGECSKSSLNPNPSPAPILLSSQRETEAEAEDSTIPRDRQRKHRSAKTGDSQQCQHREDPEPGSEEAALPVDRVQAGPRRGRGRLKSTSASITDDNRGHPEEGEGEGASCQAPVRGCRTKQKSLAAIDQQAGSTEETPRTDGASQQQASGRPRRRTGSALGQTRSVEESGKTDGSPQQQASGRCRRRAGTSPAKQAGSVEEAAQTSGASQQHPGGRGRKRSGSTLGRSESVEGLLQTDGTSQQHPAGRCRRRTVAAPIQGECVLDASQTDGSSQERPAGRGRRRAGSALGQAGSVEETSQTDGTSQQQPTGRGRRRAGTSPTKQADNVEMPQTDGTSQQQLQPAGRSRRRARTSSSKQAESVEEMSQTDGTSQQQLASRGRRKAGTSPSKQAESVEEASQTHGASQQHPGGRGRRRSVAAPIQSESVLDTSQTDGSSQERPAGRGRRRAGGEVTIQDDSVGNTPETNQSSQKGLKGRGRRKQERAQPSSQETALSSGRKRHAQGASPSESEKESSSPPQVKTRRTAGRLSSGSLLETATPPKVMFTGLVDENGVKVIKQLGGEVVESVHDSTHLVTDRIRRTVKFLCAVARGIPVVTPDWLVKSGKSSCFLSTSGFLVDDSDQEKKFNFKLAESLQKAKEQPLLQDYRVHVTSGVLPEPSQMESIVQCSGATVLPKMPRVYKAKTLVISCPDDLPKCKPARNAKVPIVNAEFILTGILQQVVDLVSYRLDLDVTDQLEGNAEKRSLAAAQSTDSRKKKR